jgi:hypothetical protein
MLPAHYASDQWFPRSSSGQPHPIHAPHHQAFVGRPQTIGAQNARQVEQSLSLFHCTTGMFDGQTIRAEVTEIQKADVGRKYAASKDRRALDPPPVAELKIFEVHDSGEQEVDYSVLQPTGLICHIEVFAVTLSSSEEPSEVLDFPQPCVHPPTPDGRRTTEPEVLAYWRGQPIMPIHNHTRSLVGDVFTQALNLPIGPNGTHTLLFVFPDVSVQAEGWFVSRYRVFDLFSLSDGSQPVLAETWGRPFRIYATKQFPGLQPSTELTKLLHRHHVPVRSREVRRKRKRNQAAEAPDSEEDSEHDKSG